MSVRCALPAGHSRLRRRRPRATRYTPPLQRFPLSTTNATAAEPLQPDPHAVDARQQLRRQLRRRRRELDVRAQRRAALMLARRLMRLAELRRARRVALYLPEGGEIDPRPLIDWLHQRGAEIYLPVLRPLVENRLWFVRLMADTQMTLNRFQIAEPSLRQSAARHRRVRPEMLDVVLMPLVGFDRQGHRLGMGGGFYDRTFAFKRYRSTRPVLIGVAHACQQVSALPAQPWDVGLDLIASDREVLRVDD
ncbi:5-formyltetrahydrofolate cyclo-ligase [Kushneria aurantia]|uniref:5-formyltetrahydrofolate cyclo-ligase n=1 Tax=Kushneria aurantia TaxID=504092 RepID=A0ABV6G1Q8_9GAMM|nr:5-formyltetrahydrofolate cyclo-ligase [Kushneria aurantia]